MAALRAALRDLAPAVAPSSPEAAALVRRAGGLPLAIRLTAAAARTMPAASVLALPASGPDDEIDRATRAVLGVVDDVARDAFLDLTLLRSGFDLDVAAGVTGLGLEQATAAIVGLADHGLLQARPDQTDPFTILEPLRAVGQRMVVDAGRGEDTADRLVDTCLDRARTLEQIASDAEVTDLEVRLRSDLPRYRQVLDHLARRRDAERALSLACRLELPLYSLGWWREQAEVFEPALAIPGPPSADARQRPRAPCPTGSPPPDRPGGGGAGGRDGELIGPRDAAGVRPLRAGPPPHVVGVLRRGRRGVPRGSQGVRGGGARVPRLRCHEVPRRLLVLDGDVDAGLALQRKALARLRRDHPSPFHVAHALAFLGHSHRLLGDDAAAFANWTEGRAKAGLIGNRATGAHLAIGLGELAVERGDLEEALALTSEALDLLAAGNVWTYEPWAWTVAMRAHLATEDIAVAAACGRRALAGLDRVPPGESVRFGTELAALAMAAHDEVTAARILGVVAVTPDRRELPFPPPAEATRRDALRQAVDDRLGNESARHLEAGSRCSLAEAAGRLLS